MELTEGSQVLLSGRAAVVISVTPFPGCEVLTLFWPATSSPPQDRGLTRPGAWKTKCVTLLRPHGNACLWDLGEPARLTLNTDTDTHIRLDAWMGAFTEWCRTS